MLGGRWEALGGFAVFCKSGGFCKKKKLYKIDEVFLDSVENTPKTQLDCSRGNYRFPVLEC